MLGEYMQRTERLARDTVANMKFMSFPLMRAPLNSRTCQAIKDFQCYSRGVDVLF